MSLLLVCTVCIYKYIIPKRIYFLLVEAEYKQENMYKHVQTGTVNTSTTVQTRSIDSIKTIL